MIGEARTRRRSEAILHWLEAKIYCLRLLSGPMIDIYVGPERRHWSIHQKLLCHHASFLETEFISHDFSERKDSARSNTLELPESDPAGFELLVKWLYQGHLQSPASFTTNGEKYGYAAACCQLWLLSEKFGMARLRNLAMDIYRKCLYETHLVPDAEEINQMYRSTPAGSRMRKLIVHVAARQIMDPEVERDVGAYRKCLEGNPDFATELIRAVRKLSGGILFENPASGSACEWHDHNDTTVCPVQEKRASRSSNQKTKKGTMSKL